MLKSLDALTLTKVLESLTLCRCGGCSEIIDAMNFTALSVILHMKSCIAKVDKGMFKALS